MNDSSTVFSHDWSGHDRRGEELRKAVGVEIQQLDQQRTRAAGSVQGWKELFRKTPQFEASRLFVALVALVVLARRHVQRQRRITRSQAKDARRLLWRVRFLRGHRRVIRTVRVWRIALLRIRRRVNPRRWVRLLRRHGSRRSCRHE
jgi:hypothetical protein